MNYIFYMLNWCGPINYEWIKENGDCWATGRVDVSGLNEEEYYGGTKEYAVRPMHKEDFARFGQFLTHHYSQELHSLDELIQIYERTNPKIRWWRFD